MAEWIGPISASDPGAMLLGRRSYEGMLGHWNRAGGPFKDALNSATNYVASSSSSTRLGWPNSTLLHGDLPAAVDQELAFTLAFQLIMGSAALIHCLMPHQVIDEYRLAIYPVVVGGGVRLFPDDGVLHRLRLVETRTTKTGIIPTGDL